MRLELFFKSSAELVALASFLRTSTPILQYNVPNKIRNDNVLECCSLLQNHFEGEADICAHYSMKNNKGKRTNQTVEKFIHFLAQAPDYGVGEVLVVSGGGSTKIAADTIFCLKHLQRHEVPLNGIELSVAFNPYYTNAESRDLEQQRLRSKIDTGLVSKVYLQFGTELDHLEEGLNFIKSLRSDDVSTKPVVLGSLFIPTPQLLNRFRLRPWTGMILSDHFLSNVENANDVVRGILRLYSSFDVEPIVESPVKSEADLEKLYTLMGSDGPTVSLG